MRPTPAMLPPITMAALAVFALAGHLVIARRALRPEVNPEAVEPVVPVKRVEPVVPVKRVEPVEIVEAVDSERRRIQRDLHDTAQQRILSIRMRLELLAGQSRLDRGAVATLARDLDAALLEIRAVTLSNSPDLLRRCGLLPALRIAAARAPLRVQVEAQDLGQLPRDIEREVYFCCLEAIQNVIKHAGARHASIRLRRSAEGMSFEVVDDGRGFDLSKVSLGEGLRNVSYRLSSVGGRLSVGANPDGGTSLRGDVPIPSQSPGDARRRPVPMRAAGQPRPCGGARPRARRLPRPGRVAAATARALSS